MQKFYDTVTDVKGNAVQGATIEVLDAGTSNQATIYEDDETTPKTNPITTGADGFYEFKAANGKYDIFVSRTGDVREVDDVIAFDVDDTTIINPETNNNNFVGDNTFAGTTAFKDGGELTISSGVITISATNHTVDTQSDAASDDLDTINGATDGEVLFLRVADAARVVTVKHGTGNIVTSDGSDIVLDSTDKISHMIYDGDASVWVVLNVGAPAVLDEDDFSSNSPTNPPSQQSVKVYVDKNNTNLTESTISTGATYDDFTAFSDGTGVYTVFLRNMTYATDGVGLAMRLSDDSTTADTGTVYAWSSQDGTTNYENTSDNRLVVNSVAMGNAGAEKLYTSRIEVHVFSDGTVDVYAQSFFNTTTGAGRCLNMSGRYVGGAQATGFQLYVSSGNVTDGDVYVSKILNFQ